MLFRHTFNCVRIDLVRSINVRAKGNITSHDLVRPTDAAQMPGFYRHWLHYDHFWPKKPEQPYGVNGVEHLNPELGRVAYKYPIEFEMKADHVYHWCTCGRSRHQPFCEGSCERTENNQQPTSLRGVPYIPREDGKVWLCQCKQTKNRPFCDGSHQNLPPDEVYDMITPNIKK